MAIAELAERKTTADYLGELDLAREKRGIARVMLARYRHPHIPCSHHYICET